MTARVLIADDHGIVREGLRTLIERESDMSGSTHNKGVFILSGYLRKKYAQEKPLTISKAHQSFRELEDVLFFDFYSSEPCGIYFQGFLRFMLKFVSFFQICRFIARCPAFRGNLAERA